MIEFISEILQTCCKLKKNNKDEEYIFILCPAPSDLEEDYTDEESDKKKKKFERVRGTSRHFIDDGTIREWSGREIGSCICCHLIYEDEDIRLNVDTQNTKYNLYEKKQLKKNSLTNENKFNKTKNYKILEKESNYQSSNTDFDSIEESDDKGSNLQQDNHRIKKNETKKLLKKHSNKIKKTVNKQTKKNYKKNFSSEDLLQSDSFESDSSENTSSSSQDHTSSSENNFDDHFNSKNNNNKKINKNNSKKDLSNNEERNLIEKLKTNQSIKYTQHQKLNTRPPINNIPKKDKNESSIKKSKSLFKKNSSNNLIHKRSNQENLNQELINDNKNIDKNNPIKENDKKSNKQLQNNNLNISIKNEHINKEIKNHIKSNNNLNDEISENNNLKSSNENLIKKSEKEINNDKYSEEEIIFDKKMTSKIIHNIFSLGILANIILKDGTLLECKIMFSPDEDDLSFICNDKIKAVPWDNIGEIFTTKEQLKLINIQTPLFEDSSLIIALHLIDTGNCIPLKFNKEEDKKEFLRFSEEFIN